MTHFQLAWQRFSAGLSDIAEAIGQDILARIAAAIVILFVVLVFFPAGR